MSISPKRQRDTQRLAHLAGAAVIGSHLYSPWSESATLTAVSSGAFFPA